MSCSSEDTFFSLSQTTKYPIVHAGILCHSRNVLNDPLHDYDMRKIGTQQIYKNVHTCAMSCAYFLSLLINPCLHLFHTLYEL